MSIRITARESSLTVDSAPWATGLLIVAAILVAVALALNGALADVVPAAWWWVSAAAGAVAFALFVSRETLHLDAATGEARYARRTVTGARTERVPLTELGPVTVPRRAGTQSTQGRAPPRLGRMEIALPGRAPWAVPDSYVGGDAPDRAAAAVTAFLAEHRPPRHRSPPLPSET